MEVFLKFLMNYQTIIVWILGSVSVGIVFLIWKNDQRTGNIDTNIKNVQSDIQDVKKAMIEQISDVKNDIKDVGKNLEIKISNLSDMINKNTHELSRRMDDNTHELSKRMDR